MNNDRKQLIPELRFPEFVDIETWAQKTIHDIAISQSSSVALNKLILKETGFPVYGADSIVGYIDKFQQKDIYVSIVKDGSGVGRLNLCVKESSVLGTLAYIKSKDAKEYNIIWIYYLLKTIDFTKYIKGAGIPHIYFADFKEERIAVPNPDEQQKIASCLSSLDELITAQKEKLELLKNHKKGLMQNLFPQEGETVPKFRFPEFENDGDWVEKKLGEICDVRDGTHDSPKYISSGYPLITSKNLMSDGSMDFFNVNYITEDDYNQINRRSKVNIGDILFGMIGTIGNPVVVKKEGFAIKNVALIKSKGTLNQIFLVYQLESDFIEQQFARVNAGGILKFIALGIIRNLKIIISSPEEQEKIAACLSSLDELISSQTEKIEKLQLHKKGLMQGLFPKVIN